MQLKNDEDFQHVAKLLLKNGTRTSDLTVGGERVLHVLFGPCPCIFKEKKLYYSPGKAACKNVQFARTNSTFGGLFSVGVRL